MIAALSVLAIHHDSDYHLSDDDLKKAKISLNILNDIYAKEIKKANKKDIWEMDHIQFKTYLYSLVKPEEIYNNAHRIYDFMEEVFGESAGDSLMREWAFQLWAETSGNDYSVIYDKWMES